MTSKTSRIERERSASTCNDMLNRASNITGFRGAISNCNGCWSWKTPTISNHAYPCSLFVKVSLQLATTILWTAALCTIACLLAPHPSLYVNVLHFLMNKELFQAILIQAILILLIIGLLSFQMKKIEGTKILKLKSWFIINQTDPL